MNKADDKLNFEANQRLMTVTDLANLGLPVVAYVRHDGPAGSGVWSIHAADGTHIGAAPNRDTAFAAVRQNDLEPLSVH